MFLRASFTACIVALSVGLAACGETTDGSNNGGNANNTGGSNNDDSARSFQYTQLGMSQSTDLCGITDDNTLVCHGDFGSGGNDFTQLDPWDGQGGVPIVSKASNFTKVDLGGQHYCALTTDNEAKCWGINVAGQNDAPTEPVVDFALAPNITCFILESGTIDCRGSGDVVDAAPDAEAIDIGVGNGFACLLSPSGQTQCWGDDTWRTLSPPATTFESITVGSNHACGLTPDGSVECWGTGDGTDPDDLFPFGQAVPPADLSDVVQVDAGKLHTCAVTESNEAVCWGLGSEKGVEEDPEAAEIYASQDHDQAAPPDEEFEQIVGGTRVSCGLLTSGKTVCWGEEESTGDAVLP